MSTVNGQPPAAEARRPVRIPRGAAQDMLVLASLWVASLWVVNPIGDFPLNDDWSFGLAVKNLLQTGQFHPTGWTSMPLISQTLWGALFCLPGGFSFNALRFSTLALSLCSLLTVYLLVRQVHPSRLLAAVAGLTVAFNPIYFALSNTFMTDVPFTAFMLAAAFFFSRYLRDGSEAALLCGLGWALAATLCRQLGLAVPIAFAVCLLWNRGLAGRWVIRALVPLAVCLGALLTFQHWLKATGRLPALYSLQNGEFLSMLCTPKRLVPGLAKHIGTALLYLGWFSFPVTILVLPRPDPARGSHRAGAIAGCVFVLCSIVVLVLSRGPMPTAGNIVMPQGIGPLSLRDVHILNLAHVPYLGKGFWLAVTAASVLGGLSSSASQAERSAALWPYLHPTRLDPEQAEGLFFLLCAVVYLSPILVIGGWDRYYIPALPFLLVGLAGLAGASSNGQTEGRFEPGAGTASSPFPSERATKHGDECRPRPWLAPYYPGPDASPRDLGNVVAGESMPVCRARDAGLPGVESSPLDRSERSAGRRKESHRRTWTAASSSTAGISMTPPTRRSPARAGIGLIGTHTFWPSQKCQDV